MPAATYPIIITLFDTVINDEFISEFFIKCERTETWLDSDKMKQEIEDILVMNSTRRYTFEFTIQSSDYFGNERPYEISGFEDYFGNGCALRSEEGQWALKILAPDSVTEISKGLIEIAKQDNIFDNERHGIIKAAQFLSVTASANLISMACWG